jgi:tetratricopeptide (TPR) repeat protein
VTPARIVPIVVVVAAAVGIAAAQAPPAAEAPEPVVLSTQPLQGVSARNVSLLMSGQSGGEVTGDMVWTVLSGPDGQSVVPVVVEVDGEVLMSGARGRWQVVEVVAYVVDQAGAVIGHLASGSRLDRQACGDTLSSSGLRFVGRLTLPAGVYSFRVLVRNRQTGVYFLGRRDLEVPSDAADELLVLPALVAGGQAWVDLRDRGAGSLAVPGLDALPAARPVWAPVEPLDVVVGTVAPEASSSVSVRVVDAMGRVVAEPSLDPELLPTGGVVRFGRARLEALGLPQGRYRLVLKVEDRDSGRSATSVQQLLVHEDGDQVWAALNLSPVDPAARRRPTRPPEKISARARELRAEYMEVLGKLLDGDVVGARAELAELETTVMAQRSSGPRVRLRRVETRVAKQIGRTRPDAVMALALLHREMSRHYTVRHQTVLSRHSWSLAAELAEEAAGLGDGLSVEGFGAALLVTIASDLARSGEMVAPEGMLQRVLVMDGRQPQALLGLGALYERGDDPIEAVRHLRELVSHHPNAHEGRLRLAVNLDRTGNSGASRRHLQQLLRRSPPQWIRALAVQELALRYLEGGQLVEAEQVLRSGIGWMPFNQRLRVQLAYVLDRLQRPRLATAELEELESRGGQHSTSPRFRYAEWPPIDQDVIGERLERAWEVGLDALREALS